jgi:hypothetical protein
MSLAGRKRPAGSVCVCVCVCACVRVVCVCVSANLGPPFICYDLSLSLSLSLWRQRSAKGWVGWGVCVGGGRAYHPAQWQRGLIMHAMQIN